jgi:hypothetical protein
MGVSAPKFPDEHSAQTLNLRIALVAQRWRDLASLTWIIKNAEHVCEPAMKHELRGRTAQVESVVLKSV